MNDRNRVLLLHPRPTRGGFSAVVMEARELSNRLDVEVAVASMRGPRVSELPSGVQYFELTTRLNSLTGFAQYRRILREYRPTVLHLHGRMAGAIGRMTTPGAACTVLYTPHGTPWVGTSGLRRTVGDLLERVLLTRTDGVLCVSYSELADWTPRDRNQAARVLPNPIAFETDQASAELLASGQIVVPSGYNPQKRLEVVLDALAQSDVPERVNFFGSVDRPRYLQWLKERAARMGIDDRVTFHGSTDRILAEMRDASLVILPSFSEGMPIVAQQAIDVGANVAWSRIPPHFELFGEAGKSFWTSEELAAVMSGNHSEADVSRRQVWMVGERARIRDERSKFWNDIFSRDADD